MTPSRGAGRFGLLVPFTNTNLEADMVLMRPPGVSLHWARLGGYDEDEIPDEAQMQGLGSADLDDPLHLLAGVKPDVVFYGCTSATLTHGPAFDAALSARIRQTMGAATVTAASALVAACRALGASRIGFASPYVPEINRMAVDFLSREGIRTVQRVDVTERLSNDGQGALTPEAVMALGQRADHPEAQAVVLSCTDMRAVEIADALETQLGKPVITSNQAMVFAALSALGQTDPLPGFGRLLADAALRTPRKETAP